MKMSNLKRITILMIVLVSLLFITPLLAQAVGEQVEVPEITLEIFFSIPALVAFVLAATAIIKKSLITSGGATQYISWAVSILASGIGYYLDAGIFMNMAWYYILIYGFAVGLISNGLFDWKLIKQLLLLFKLYNKPLV